MTEGRYHKISFLGEGNYAMVYKAKDVRTDRIVAVKKMQIAGENTSDGVSRNALREIKFLKEIHHENIIDLLDVDLDGSAASLVLEYMEGDLWMLIQNRNVVFSNGDMKAYMMMLLTGVDYLHKRWILHRDLKPSNLLVSSSGALKISDFGLAKYYGSPGRNHTPLVVTRWYRAPELLLGAKQYGIGIDVWSVGCIFAELMLRHAFLMGHNDFDQLNKIFTVFGTPSAEILQSMRVPLSCGELKPRRSQVLHYIFTGADNDMIALLKSAMHLDPACRCTAREALQLQYFSSQPSPTPLHLLPKLTNTNTQNAGQTNSKRKPVEPPNEEGLKAAKIRMRC